MRGKQKERTQKDKVLELLQTGEPISRNKLWNLSGNDSYRKRIQELRSAGYEITCTITLNGTFYQLKEGKHVDTNIATSVQILGRGQTRQPAAGSI